MATGMDWLVDQLQHWVDSERKNAADAAARADAYERVLAVVGLISDDEQPPTDVYVLGETAPTAANTGSAARACPDCQHVAGEHAWTGCESRGCKCTANREFLTVTSPVPACPHCPHVVAAHSPGGCVIPGCFCQAAGTRSAD